MHSQRPRETPLKPWIITEKDGKILGGHCDCMAGLGETCTHISAMLFYIETKVRIRESTTVTQEAAYWKLPAAFKIVTYLPVSEIDFTSAKTKKKQIDALVYSNEFHTPSKRKVKEVAEASFEDLSMLFDKLTESDSKAAILSVVPGHCHIFKPTLLSGNYATVLTDLYDRECTDLPFHELLERCQAIKLHLTQDQAVAVEQATQAQADNKMWFRFRAGRVTASKMKSACSSNPDQPSQSLVKAICYPGGTSFTNAALKWGCQHECTARQAYLDRMIVLHDNFQLSTSGLILNPTYPHLGASPDGRVTCNCCGAGVVEIKCPYCAREGTIQDYCSNRVRTCLDDAAGSATLKSDHAYMYQLQTQIHISEVEYGDFVLWTEQDLHVERVMPDETMWQNIVVKSHVFFRKAILPELVGKFYTRTRPVLCAKKETAPAQPDTVDCYCYCRRGGDVGDLIGCDYENCKIQWFHQDCLKIKNIPKGKWFCPECRKLPQNKRVKSKKK